MEELCDNAANTSSGNGSSFGNFERLFALHTNCKKDEKSTNN